MANKLLLLLVVVIGFVAGKRSKVSIVAQASNGQTVGTEPTTTCPSDETAVTGSVDCPSDYCATSEAQSLTTCTYPEDSCTSSATVCTCGFNQRRTSRGGSCISVYDCPPFDCSCRPNEVYNSCPPFCPTDDCSYAPFNGTCPLGNIGIVLTCVPKCTCAEGYYRNDGVCIPRAECPSIQDQTSSTPVIATTTSRK